jgi:hypothetical protein
MITNMHTGMESVERERKRPRITNINKRNVLAIWGNDPVKKMEIPAVIDDYNHFMGGVDKADQLIQSYRPDIRCRRTWMPIFLHCMDIARINAYIMAKKKHGVKTQKEFVMSWINALNQRAVYEEYKTTRASAAAALMTTPSGSNKKRTRVGHKRPNLPDYRFLGKKEEHVPVLTAMQRRCRYCSHLKGSP